MREVQPLAIVDLDWFQKYKNACVNSVFLQKVWSPSIGDWFERHYRLDLGEISKEEYAIEIIHYKSEIKGYYQVVSHDGKNRIWNSDVEIAKGTSKWIPRLDQLLVEHDIHTFYGASIGEIHMQALERFLKLDPNI